MDLLDPLAFAALAAAALMLAVLMAVRRRLHALAGRGRAVAETPLDTATAWPPQATRVLTIDERRAYELLRRALPGMLVLAQVPLARFLRVPTRHSYAEWMQRVGSLSADLLVCDAGSRVLAVIDIRSSVETERSRHRHDRLARALGAAGIAVHVWREGELPAPAQVRDEFAALLRGRELPPVRATPSRPMPLIPVAEIEEVLADGDRLALDRAYEPVPSAFFDEIEALSAPTPVHA